MQQSSPKSPRNPRSRQGCWTCRAKKVKCDEGQPRCLRCCRLDRVCDYAPRPRKKYTKHSKERPSPGSSPPSPEILVQEAASISEGSEQQTLPSVTGTTNISGWHSLSPSHAWDAEVCVDEGLATASLMTRAQQNGDDNRRLTLSRACYSIATPADFEAIQCFRTVITEAVDTKDPKYSVPSIVWCLAQTQPIVLHMICALGGQQLLYQDSDECRRDPSGQLRAVEHYGASMRLLAEAIQHTDNASSLETILATLWLMIWYEHRFGDGCGLGLNAHLKGAASVLHSRLRNLRDLLNWDERYGLNNSAAAQEAAAQHDHWTISPFAGRMIVWISFLDAGASFHGIGGEFNQSLGAVMAELAENEMLSRLRGFSSIHRYSVTMGRAIWGQSYPQTQLLEDLDNRQLFYLYGESGQLRYFLSQLSQANRQDEVAFRNLTSSLAQALRVVGERYSELLEVASELSFASAGSRQKKFISNIRFIVPYYHTAVLCYFRITSARGTPTNKRQKRALSEVITLAFQSHSEEGDVAMTRMAWPLFISALESEDLVHQEWILSRFAYLQTQGENYRRAYEALKVAKAERHLKCRGMDYLELLGRSDLEKFVL